MPLCRRMAASRRLFDAGLDVVSASSSATRGSRRRGDLTGTSAFERRYRLLAPVGSGYDQSATLEQVAVNEGLLAELRTTKAAIDELQQKLKDIVAELRERGASAQEIGEALRS